MSELRDEIADMIADWYGRSAIGADFDLAQQIIDRVRSAALPVEPDAEGLADLAFDHAVREYGDEMDPRLPGGTR